MTVSVDKAMSLFGKALQEYECTKKLTGGVVLHLAPVGITGYYVGTITAYDVNGMKSERALPFSKYIRLVNEIEDLITPYQEQSFTGRLVGWNPTPIVKNFLYEKKVHRLFFLSENNVLTFLNNYTSKMRIENRISEGYDVAVMYG